MLHASARSSGRRPRALLAAAVALLVPLGLAACSSDDDDSAADTTSVVSEPFATDTSPTETSATDTSATDTSAADTTAADTTAVPCPATDGSSEQRRTFPAPPPECIDPAKTYRAVIETTKGRIVVALDAARAPETVNNFVYLARYHYFDGISFHRVVPGFVIQGGDPQGTGMGGPGYEFSDELPEAGQYQIGSLAMANAGPDTNGSQFFIITGAQGTRLPPNYSLFGQVVEGQDVVAAIDALGVGDGPPSEPVSMTTVTIEEQ